MIFPPDATLLSSWRIRFPIKAGADAETYRVSNSSGDTAFLKVFHLERIAEDRILPDGQLLEVVIAASLDYDGIPRVITSGNLDEANGARNPYVLMDLIPGETLDNRLNREVVLSPAHAQLWMQKLLGTVAYLHSLEDPVLHNQLTPSNVLLDASNADERPVLIDFGHARRISDGLSGYVTPTNPYYLANECLERGESSPATDVFALGALYYRMLFGIPPWDLGISQHRATRTSGSPQSAIRTALLEARMRRFRVPVHAIGGEVPDDALAVIRTALRTNPDDRFENAAAFLKEITPKRRTRSSFRPPDTPVGPPKRIKQLEPMVRGFDRVAGMEKLKRLLTDDVINALRNKDEYEKLGLTIPNGMLLYGPPGCGKTFISKRFGEEVGFLFIPIGPSDIASQYIHGTQEKIRAIFDNARRESPCVLFLDEFDAMVPSRDGYYIHHSYQSEVNEWLTQMDNAGEEGVFIVAATNRPSGIDKAILRTGRIDRQIYVGPPDYAARKAIFELELSDRSHDEAIDGGELAGLTKGWVSSDIVFVVDEAARSAIKSNPRKITMSHLRNAIMSHKPSVNAEQIAEYEKMRDIYEGKERGRSKPIGF